MLNREKLENKLSEWPLSWISRSEFTSIVRDLMEEAKPKERGLDYKNIVDPFSALFDMTVSGIGSYDEWVRAEIRRQHQKTLQNAVGKFHQRVLGRVEGWVDLGVGEIFDLLCPSRKIFAEVKNKFNTVKASNKKDLYKSMGCWIGATSEHFEYTGYYVQILTRGKFNRPFVPSDNTTKSKVAENPKIREIDGTSFYTLVTGSPTAFRDVYNILPFVLQDICPTFDAKAIAGDETFDDLFLRATGYR